MPKPSVYGERDGRQDARPSRGSPRSRPRPRGLRKTASAAGGVTASSVSPARRASLTHQHRSSLNERGRDRALIPATGRDRPSGGGHGWTARPMAAEVVAHDAVAEAVALSEHAAAVEAARRRGGTARAAGRRRAGRTTGARSRRVIRSTLGEGERDGLRLAATRTTYRRRVEVGPGSAVGDDEDHGSASGCLSRNRPASMSACRRLRALHVVGVEVGALAAV